MSLSFLYPLMWLAATTAIVPIVLHLRRRRDSRVVHFSAMQFLEDQPLARRPFISPRDWPLLLLRLLALLLLVAAFALPYFPRMRQPVITDSRVYVLDNTLSHRVDGGFDGARETIVNALSRTDVETQIAVVELTHKADALVSFGEGRDAAMMKLQALEPSYQRGSYLSAFRLANSLLQQSLGARRHIVLLGDSQTNQWDGELGTPPFLVDTEVLLPEVGSPTRPNAALMDPTIQSVPRGNRTIVQCSTRLFRQGIDTDFEVVFRSNRNETARRQVTIPRDADAITISAEWEIQPTEWVLGEIQIEGNPDSMPEDDRVVFSLAPAREGRLALLAGSAFLRTALSPEVMRGRWNVSVLDSPDDVSAAGKTTDFNVLCVESNRLTAARDFVIQALDAGHGVLLFVDRDTAVAEGYLRELGIELNPPGPRGKLPGFRYVSMEHPIFRPFRSPDFGSLDDIEIHHHRNLQLTDASPLAFSHTGQPLIWESNRWKGRLLVFAFTMDRDDTSWPMLPTFVPFLDKCFQHLRRQVSIRTHFEPGETCIWPVDSEEKVNQVSLVAEDAIPPTVVARAEVEQNQARLSIPGRPGLYAIRYDDRPDIAGVLDVNPPAQESYLSYTASPEVVATWQCVQTAVEPSSKSERPVAAHSVREVLRQRLWWWLLLAGLTALMLETLWVSLRTVG